MAPRQVKTTHNKRNPASPGPEAPTALGRRLRGPQGKHNVAEDTLSFVTKAKEPLGKRKMPSAKGLASSTNRKGSPPKKKKSTAKEDAALSKGKSHSPQAAEAITELGIRLGKLLPLLEKLHQQCSHLNSLLVPPVDH
jgi:hypothetical protein